MIFTSGKALTHGSLLVLTEGVRRALAEPGQKERQHSINYVASGLIAGLTVGSVESLVQSVKVAQVSHLSSEQRLALFKGNVNKTLLSAQGNWMGKGAVCGLILMAVKAASAKGS